jgi:hypothetical protein
LANTYDRRTQRLASKRRYEDALALQDAGRWNGAIYLGGYAIECSLISLICYTEGKTVVTETKMFNDGVQGASLHDLGQLLAYASTEINLMMRTDKSRTFNEARKIVVRLWQMTELRYGAKVTHKNECERFMAAVELLYSSIKKRLDKYERGYDD